MPLHIFLSIANMHPNSIHNSACTVLNESGELVSDPGCMSSAILPTPTPTIDSKDPDSSSDGLDAGVATAVGALVVVIIVVVVVVAVVVCMMTRKRKLLQQRVFEEPDFLRRYLFILCWHVFLIVIQHLT